MERQAELEAEREARAVPQAVVDQKTFEEYTSQLTEIDWAAELDNQEGPQAVDNDQLMDAECAMGACPIR